MNPGKLDRRVEILAPTIVISASSGGASEIFTVVAVVWAQRIDGGGREYRSSGALNADKNALFTMRYKADLTTRHRLRCEKQEYDILDIGETMGRRTFIAVQTKARLP